VQKVGIQVQNSKNGRSPGAELQSVSKIRVKIVETTFKPVVVKTVNPNGSLLCAPFNKHPPRTRNSRHS